MAVQASSRVYGQLSLSISFMLYSFAMLYSFDFRHLTGWDVLLGLIMRDEAEQTDVALQLSS
jgi:hypothetical protein